ncbi:protein-L-isoaspartate(D-aspartate) O-methyltransferase [Geminicoccus roseus]|uniref:protein-L-isoaspartate(D-aspartate) O-methyltransferase n=1 Tax=Geminicoccus roseus TaxID=404900 RepID=UPI00041A5F9C|nr:protein-L-isoaspartate(D-aspartate) O-methyltransferase [Geminicoccus roseus]
MSTSARAREQMVAQQLVRRGISDGQVLRAMRNVPREAFVAERLQESAYDDAPLPIEEGQTISQPYVVALMIQAAALRPGDRVLEIGTGSGYAAAVMAEIAQQVHSVERHPRLAQIARQRLELLRYPNVEVHEGDGTLGWPDAAPYDAILAAAGGPSVPDPLRAQLAEGGRLVMPVGDEAGQRLLLVIRKPDGSFDEKDLGSVAFVPMIGRHGWSEPAAGG